MIALIRYHHSYQKKHRIKMNPVFFNFLAKINVAGSSTPYGKRLLIKVSIYDKVLLEYGEENRGAVK